MSKDYRYVREGFLALLVLVGEYLVSGGYWPLCRFKSEIVTLTLVQNQLHVNGLYRYEHKWPVTAVQGFSCPFPTGDGLGEIQEFVAELLPNSSCPESTLLPVTWSNGVAYFQARIPPGQVTEVRIRYIQQMADTGKYFLTTTQPWRRSLEHGRYELNLPDSQLLSCNYPFETAGPGRYAFERTDFLPDRDWVFIVELAGNAK